MWQCQPLPYTSHTATVILRTDITVECPHTPHLFRCFFCIPFSGLRARNLYTRAKMRPRQIVNARVHNLQIIETQIKMTEVVQIPLIERIAVFKHQPLCQCLNQPGTVLGTDFAMLFFLHDTPPDVPIGKYRNSIGRRVGLSPTFSMIFRISSKSLSDAISRGCSLSFSIP